LTHDQNTDPLPEILAGFSTLDEVNDLLVNCRRCPRLVAWREETASASGAPTAIGSIGAGRSPALATRRRAC
jgi:uracil-DNA glycosylase